MDKEEAFRKLRFEPNVYKDEINSKFKDLAHLSHPDKGGNNNEMSELLEARDVALRSFDSNLVSFSDLNEIIRSQNNYEETKRQQIESHKNLIKQIVNNHTRRNKSYKTFSLYMGSLSTLFFFIATQAQTVIGSNESNYDDFIPSSVFFYLLPGSLLTPVSKFGYNLIYNIFCLRWIIFLLAIFFGLLYLITTIKVSRVEHAVDDIGEMLGNKREYFVILSTFGPLYKELNKKSQRNSLDSSNGSELFETKFTEDTLVEITKIWMLSHKPHPTPPFFNIIFGKSHIDVPTIIKTIGSKCFARLFISKGVEMGILNEYETIIEGRLLVQYSLSIKNRETF